MRTGAVFIVIGLLPGCDGKTMGTAIGTSVEGTGGESGRPLDAGAAGGTGGTQIPSTGGLQAGASNVTARTDAGRDSKIPRDATVTVTLPACANQATTVDGGADVTCTGARTYLHCHALNPTQGGGLAGETCLSDDPTRCPPGPAAFLGPFTCEDQCEPTEYAVGCYGGPAFSAFMATLPAACREINGRYGEVFCCPCGS